MKGNERRAVRGFAALVPCERRGPPIAIRGAGGCPSGRRFGRRYFFFAAQGLHGLTFFKSTFFAMAAHGLQGLVALLAAHGLHAASWIRPLAPGALAWAWASGSTSAAPTPASVATLGAIETDWFS